MKKIKNIIFDLGNVLFPISGEATIREFEKQGVVNMMDKYKRLIDNDLLLKLEVGEVSPEVFRSEVNRIFESNLSAETFNHCWNAMIVSYPEKNNPFLESLKARGYNLYILSNTNAIHVEYLKPMANWRDGLFTKIYYSNEIGKRKPNKDCYEWVLNDAEIEAEETLFIDDRPENTLSAQSCNIATITLDKQENLYSNVEGRLK